ncbi:GspE/PulE family protein [Ethanoligenens sp.]|uniref:GspE/PulE family protein n=1 Tax=Ethanoligenens sp. TaxID=2099655 RepID=UPI0039E7EE8B
MTQRSEHLGQILLNQKRITREQLEEVLRAQKKRPGQKIGNMLVEMQFITENDLMEALHEHFKIPSIDLTGTPIQQSAIALVPQELAEKYNVFPVREDGRTLTIATSDPLNYYAMDDIRLAADREIVVMLGTLSGIRNAIARYYSGQRAEEAAEDLSRQFVSAQEELPMNTEMGERLENAPVVRLVNSIITQAVKMGASDIHIEPAEQETRVRMRLDGLLRQQMNLPASAHASVIARLKIMSDMDIAERRIPQDGRIETIIDGKPIDLRLSILPTVTGEKMVIRVLGGTSVLQRSQLGLDAQNVVRFETILKSPNGIVLVCGPTGSGKTTTLYSVLKDLNAPEINMITIEDPVEFRLPGVNQVQINTKAGLTFASGLRSMLRQDPDIIMVGEIRDAETAEMAVRSAITGHLVFSTVHTNDAVSTVTRLVNMGVQPFMIASSLVGVDSQRLVRRICRHCAEEYTPADEECKSLGLPAGVKLWRGRGCNYCSNTGYKGRMAIHEILIITKEIRQLIESGATEDRLQEAALADGMVPLFESAKKAVLAGETTVSELMRVAYHL